VNFFLQENSCFAKEEKKMGSLKLYRSVIPKEEGAEHFIDYRSTMRPPGNVPYIVDNLWEWKRPEGFPCRRSCAYASPDPELALKSGPQGGTVFEIQFRGEYRIAQVVGYPDSKFHPECGGKARNSREYSNLKKTIIRLLNKSADRWWPDLDLEEKLHAGQLWIPCLTKKEIDYLFGNIPALQRIKDEMASRIKYWDDVVLLDPGKNTLPDKEGEIFFQAKGGYSLKPIT
jgi:hypothetical protein